MNLDKKFYAILDTTTNLYVDVSSNINRAVFNPHIIADSIEEISKLHAQVIFNSPYEEFKIVELTVISNDVKIQYNKTKIIRDISIKFVSNTQKSFDNLESMLKNSYNNRYLLFLMASGFNEASCEFNLNSAIYEFAENSIFWLYDYGPRNNIFGLYTNDLKYLTMLKLVDNDVLVGVYDTEELKWI